jgi:hypothetical protein
MRTFDLRAAGRRSTRRVCLPAPRHRAVRLRYIILLVYGAGALSRRRSVLHGQGGQTLIEMLPVGRSTRLSDTITDALATAALDLLAPAEVEYYS